MGDDLDELKAQVARLQDENAALASEKADFQKRFVRLQDETKRRKNTEKELAQLRDLVSSMATEVARAAQTKERNMENLLSIHCPSPIDFPRLRFVRSKIYF